MFLSEKLTKCMDIKTEAGKEEIHISQVSYEDHPPPSLLWTTWLPPVSTGSLEARIEYR